MKKKESTHWVWAPYSPVRGAAFVTEMSGLSARQDSRMVEGERLSPVPSIVIKDHTPGRFYDQLGTYNGVILVSPVLRKVLEKTPGARLQFIPARLPSKPEQKYFVVNVLDTLPALDLERSKFDTFAGTTSIRRITKFVPRPIQDDAPPIFHITEKPTIILVNDELRQRLADASKHPGVLTPVDKYRNEF